MYVSEIKEKYPLVYERLRVQSRVSEEELLNPTSRKNIHNSLIWRETTEEYDFWSAVHLGNWYKAKELQPSLFSETVVEEEDVKITTNGLFK